MIEAYILDAVRTPIGKFCGSLSTVRADDLAAFVLRRLLDRHPSLDPAEIEDVILGCANQAGEDNRNVARMALLLAGLPASVAGVTVNRLCASGMSATIDAARAIRLGEGDFHIAGGVEQMTRAPFVMSKSEAPFSRAVELYDTSLGWRFVNPKMRETYGVDGMGCTAEILAEQFQIARADQDRFAYHSQRKAAAARGGGRLAQEIAPVEIPQRKGLPIRFEADEFLRPETTMETLARLKPVFRTDGAGSVTAGNSSGLNDGACAILVGSEAGANRIGARPMARLVSWGAVGVEPRVMGIGPVDASRKALRAANLRLDDIDLIEINEAFAVQCLACLRQLGVPDDDPRVNVNGGAIALGHPLGMSGARILASAAFELQNRKLRHALCTLCVGVGQGMATILERVE